MRKRIGVTLQLSRETLRALDPNALQEIQGAATVKLPCSFPCTKVTICPAPGAGIRPPCIG